MDYMTIWRKWQLDKKARRALCPGPHLEDPWFNYKMKEVAGQQFEVNPSVVSHIIIHHSLTRDGALVNWESIKRYHTSWRYNGEIVSSGEANRLKEEGYGVTAPWSDIGYHWGCELVGDEYKILKGRPMTKRGAHCRDGGFNRKSVGFCFIGTFDYAGPCGRQWDLSIFFVDRLRRYLNVPVRNVIGHGEAQGIAGVTEAHRKSCPGRHFGMELFRINLEEMA